MSLLRMLPLTMAVLVVFAACRKDGEPADTGVDPGTGAEVESPGDGVVEDPGTETGRGDVPAGPCTPGECDDQNVCTDDTCDPVQGCRFVPNTIPCEDGDACTLNDTCGNGSCQAGAPKDCSDGNPCTDDTCGASGACVHADNTGACNDGKDCTTDDACAGGACAGTARACDDGNACTVDGCAEGQGCTNTPAEEGTTCNDGNDCTSNDRCQAGVCKGDGKSCDDGNPCTDDTCTVETQECKNLNRVGPCDDANRCTASDACSNGVCTGTPLNCDDGNACSADTCDAATGTCRHGFKDCDDSDPCTLDTCDAATGECGHVQKTCLGTPCAPGSCDGTTGECVNTPKACADANKCTADYCDLATGACVHDAYTGACTDGDKCTFEDSCATGTCVGHPCDDGNTCTTDTCDPMALKGGCKFTALAAGSKCNDGNACTINDTCKTLKDDFGCAGTKKTCDDGNACTYDTCDPAKGCVYVAIKGCVTCAGDKECGGGFCSGGICFAKKPDGEACSSGTQCESGNCQDNGSGVTVCMKSGLAAGLACVFNRECQSGFCNPDFTCGCNASAPCGANSYCLLSKCVPRVGRGLPCTETAQCLEGLVCESDPVLLFKVCALDGTEDLGRYCLRDIECKSNHCFEVQLNTGLCVCSEDADCGTRKWCRENVCIPCCGSIQVCKPCLKPCCDWKGLDCDATCGCSCGTFYEEDCAPGCPGA